MDTSNNLERQKHSPATPSSSRNLPSFPAEMLARSQRSSRDDQQGLANRQLGDGDAPEASRNQRGDSIKIERAAPVGEVLGSMRLITLQAELAEERIRKSLNEKGISYLLKEVSLGAKRSFLYDLQHLCLLVEDVSLERLEKGKEREAVVALKFNEATNALQKVCYPVKSFARDHSGRAKRIGKDMLELLKRLAAAVRRLADSVRAFTGEVRTPDNQPYGKSVHLVTSIEGCVREWEAVV